MPDHGDTAGRTIITKRRCVRLVHAFSVTYLRPFIFPMHVVVWWMLQTGRFILSGTWASRPDSAALDRETAQLMWQITMRPGDCQPSDVYRVLHRAPYPPSPEVALGRQALESAMREQWPLEWPGFFKLREIRHLIAQHLEQHGEPGPGELPAHTNMLRDAGKAFLLAYGSEEIKRVVRDFPGAVGFGNVDVTQPHHEWAGRALPSARAAS